MTIGIFGSAFNPPTRGHLNAITQALSVCREVWLVPSIDHAFGKAMLPFETRWSMVQAFVAELNDSQVTACDIEADIWDGKTPVYTFEVLNALQSRFPTEQFTFLCGPDNARQFERFAHHRKIRQQWGVHSLTDDTGIRSTLVRERLQSGESIETLVIPGIHHIIKQGNLYV